MEITPEFLQDRNVLFVVETKHGFSQTEYVSEGSVIGIDEENQTVDVCFLYSLMRASTTLSVPFSHIYSVNDDENGTQMRIHSFSGKMHDLRDKSPFGTHKIPEMADD